MSKEISRTKRILEAHKLYNDFEEFKEKYVERVCIDFDNRQLQLISHDGFICNIDLYVEEREEI